MNKFNVGDLVVFTGNVSDVDYKWEAACERLRNEPAKVLAIVGENLYRIEMPFVNMQLGLATAIVDDDHFSLYQEQINQDELTALL